MRIAATVSLLLVAAGAAAATKQPPGPGPQQILRKFDLDHNGSIDATEAVAMNEALAANPKRPIAALDTSGDGKLDEKEIAALNAQLEAFAAKKAAAPKKTGQRAAKAPKLDCAAGTGTATISWAPPTENADESPLKDLAGYVIRYGVSPQSLVCRVVVAKSSATEYVVEHLGEGTWYFSVAAQIAPGSRARRARRFRKRSESRRRNRRPVFVT